MNRDHDTILSAAAEWHAASDGDDMDWQGFTAWLEADPRHRMAYDQIALTGVLIDEHRQELASVGPTARGDEPDAPCARPSPRAWRRWATIALAASLVGLLALPQFLRTPTAVYETEASSRSISLADGSRIVLAPHSRLSVEGRREERMALAGGAWFDIRHNEDRPLTIAAGTVTIRDIGTQFDVQAIDGSVRVEVGKGKLSVTSDALSTPVQLTERRSLLFDRSAGTATVQAVAPADVGEWRSGRLSYDSVPLTLVAADLSRYAGVEVTVADALRDREFSGTLVIGNGTAALRDLSQLMDIELDRGAVGYRLDARAR